MSIHLPVLLDQVITHLRVTDGGMRVLDATFGGGGHTGSILEAASDNSVVALDADPAAATRAEGIARKFPDRFTFISCNFSDFAARVSGQFDAILFDLGLSSFQFDTPERGFSFRFDAPADMRLDPRVGIPASDFLERASREEMVRAIRNFGEEPRWRAVVDALINARGTGKLSRTASLAELISAVVGTPKGRPSRIHPATRSFQGIRIAVNGELDVLESVLPDAFAALTPGGRLAVISFHSLEDRMVKRFFRRMAGRAEHARDTVPQDFRKVYATEVTRRPVIPSDEETRSNPRSRSAKLRVLEKLKAA